MSDDVKHSEEAFVTALTAQRREPGTAAQPLTTVEVALFTVRAGELRVLLVRRTEEPFAGMWALPGGGIDGVRDRDLESCARRTVREMAGTAGAYVEQLGSWGSATRDPRGWSASHVYLALMADPGEPRPGTRVANAEWCAVAGNGVKLKLAFDHRQLLEAALVRLRGKAEYTSLPAYVLPREFTLGELQRAFEIVLGREVEKSAFRTRILAADFVEALPRMREGPNRPAQLYRLSRPGEVVFFPRTFSPRSG